MVLRNGCRDRVTIRFSNTHKHGIPVGEECGYAHKHNFAPVGREVCRGQGKLPPQDHADVRSCVKDSNCDYMDNFEDEQQIAMAVLRGEVNRREVSTSGVRGFGMFV